MGLWEVGIVRNSAFGMPSDQVKKSLTLCDDVNYYLYGQAEARRFQ